MNNDIQADSESTATAKTGMAKKTRRNFVKNLEMYENVTKSLDGRIGKRRFQQVEVGEEDQRLFKHDIWWAKTFITWPSPVYAYSFEKSTNADGYKLYLLNLSLPMLSIEHLKFVLDAAEFENGVRKWRTESEKVGWLFNQSKLGDDATKIKNNLRKSGYKNEVWKHSGTTIAQLDEILRDPVKASRMREAVKHLLAESPNNRRIREMITSPIFIESMDCSKKPNENEKFYMLLSKSDQKAKVRKLSTFKSTSTFF